MEKDNANTNAQILSDIQQLQNFEKELFLKLENGSSMSEAQRLKLSKKINSISEMRVNLYASLNSMNTYFKGAVENSNKILTSQSVLVEVMERELNRAKERLDSIESERHNKLRMIQINDYYGKQYDEHTDFMKIVIFMLIPIIGLLVLKNKGLIPIKLYYGLVIFVSLIGSLFLSKTLFSILSRSSINYDEYKWNFNPSSESGESGESGEGSTDPWKSEAVAGCVGEACCSGGQFFDTVSQVCITEKNKPQSEIETFVSELNQNRIYTQTKKPDIIF
jgi:hypothetical protein